MEKTGNGYLENELDIKTAPKFSLTTINDTLELFESQSNLGCTAIFILLFSAILFFVDRVTLMVFFCLPLLRSDIYGDTNTPLRGNL
ncbi:hypothetical protein OQX63_22045 [Pedobacter sp. PF22-3]|uniref:hypothetical protein n=1 Tax=Pedobacter sp. PF22-3 TaxID=2994467 RepID=UPI0022450D90|nr:hypothetical protein [Pedobacter sp. PF22-3]MCX2496193.1 hypothetical protein [Pedobacter sp. PF22-3]